MAIQTTFPAIKPTLLLDFAKVKQLDPRITFTRASTATFYNSVGVLSTAAAGVPRFDYNPTTEESLGLLIEEQRTNLLTYSEQFDNAAWVKTNSSITANNLLSPDGLVNADLFSADSTITTSARDLRRNITTTVSSTHTFSVYAKANNANFFALMFRNQAASANSITAEFNLANGTISVAATNNGNATGATASITPVNNGWYRCSISGIADTSGTSLSTLLFGRTTSNSAAVAADTQMCFIWGAQLEAGAFPTSYIQTVASQVTRAADSASMTGTNFSSWYNAAEGTLYGEFSQAVLTGGVPTVYSVNLAPTPFADRIIAFGNSNTPETRVTAGGVEQATFNLTGAYTAGQNTKLIQAYKVNDFASTKNGNAASTDVVGILPVVNQFQIGSISGLSYMNGHIRKIAYYPIRCTNAQLVALTS